MDPNGPGELPNDRHGAGTAERNRDRNAGTGQGLPHEGADVPDPEVIGGQESSAQAGREILGTGGFGIAAPFWAYAALSLVALVVSLFCADDHSAADIHADETPAPPLRSLGTNPIFLATCFLAFGSAFTRTAAHWQMVPFLAAERFGMGFGLIGVLRFDQRLKLAALLLLGLLVAAAIAYVSRRTAFASHKT